MRHVTRMNESLHTYEWVMITCVYTHAHKCIYITHVYVCIYTYLYIQQYKYVTYVYMYIHLSLSLSHTHTHLAQAPIAHSVVARQNIALIYISCRRARRLTRSASVCCSVLRCVAVWCSWYISADTYSIHKAERVRQHRQLQHTTTHCNTLQHTATHCNTLQHTATHASTRTPPYTNCLMHASVTSHTRMSHVTHTRMSHVTHTRMSHVTHIACIYIIAMVYMDAQLSTALTALHLLTHM